MQDGIYLPDGSFRSKEQIVSDNYEVGEVIHRSPDPHTPLDFERFNQEMIRRQEFLNEVEPRVNNVEVEIRTDRPIAIAMLGDTHLGGRGVDYKLLGEIVTLIRDHPLMYVYGMGDFMDALFFNQQEDIAQNDTQSAHTLAMIRELKDKWLGFHLGDHDFGWADKRGPTIYRTIREMTGAPMSTGPTVVRYHVGTEEGSQTYTVVQTHRPKGFSIYNPLHPLKRMATLGGIQGADAYISAHTHTKAVGTDVIHSIDGAKKVHLGITGPFQFATDYAQNKLAFPEQSRDEKSLGPIFMLLRPDKKDMMLIETSEQTVSILSRYLG